MNQPAEVTQDEAATELATTMLEQEGVMRAIIEETIGSAIEGNIREAGRTLCPTNNQIKGPLNRFPRAIDLAACPTNKGGTWHTHVTPREIKRPVNSLPDMSNVIFGLTDVSVVAGTEHADVIVSPQNHDQAAEVFRNAIGAEVFRPADLSDAIEGGRIVPTPARQRAREQLSELVFQVDTGFSDLTEAAAAVPPTNWAAPHGSGMDESFSGNQEGATAFAPDSFQVASDAADDVLSGTQIRDEVVSTAIGTIIGGIVSRVVFGK